jgi:sensor domain CHASE-containing protein
MLPDLKKFGFGFVSGAIVLLILAFSTGWVVTSSTAQQKAEQQAAQAVDQSLADICVQQFKHSGDIDKKLQKLKEMDYSWDRAEYIKKQGWATMPGERSPSPGVADNCAKQLMQEYEKKG